jgi:predicted branched-subunit amino acid permease
MDGSGLSTASPLWTGETGRTAAAWRGVRETPFVPPLVLFSTFIGFGALANETGFSWLHTVLMSVFIFALPGQVVLVDEMTRGATILTAAIAVAATGVRLLPMTVSLLPVIRDRRSPKWMEFAIAYYCAVTVWVEGVRRTPDVPRHLRASYVLGIAVLMIFVSSAGALTGFFLAASVPPVISAALLFMMPIYFLLSMLASTRTVIAALPLIFGLLLGPLFHVIAPDFDLVLTGLIGGTASFLIARASHKAGPRP